MEGGRFEYPEPPPPMAHNQSEPHSYHKDDTQIDKFTPK